MCVVNWVCAVYLVNFTFSSISMATPGDDTGRSGFQTFRSQIYGIIYGILERQVWNTERRVSSPGVVVYFFIYLINNMIL